MATAPETTLLQSLINEPGDFVTAVPKRLDIDPVGALTAAKIAAPERKAADSSAERTVSRTTYDAFVPAPPELVWALLDDVEQRPEWDNTITSIEPAGLGQWIGRTHGELPGTSWRLPQRMRPRSIVLVAREEHCALEWETISLGTRLRLSRERSCARSLGPITRFLAAAELTGIASGVSRFFRT